MVVNSIKRPLQIMLSTQVLRMLLALATQVVIARLLGPEGRGLYAVYFSISTIFFTVITFGGEYGIRHLFFRNEINKSQAFSLLMLVSMNSLLVAALMAFAMALSQPLHTYSISLDLLSGSLLFVVSQFLAVQLNVLLTMKERYHLSAIFSIAEECSRLLLVYLFLTYSNDVLGVFFVSSIPSVVVIIITLVKDQAVLFSGMRLSLGDVKRVLQYGWQAGWININNLSHSNIMTLISGSLLGVQAAGFYSVAYGMAIRLQVIPDAVNRVLVGSATTEVQSKVNIELTVKAIKLLTLICIIIFAFVSLTSEVLVGVLLGVEYADVAIILPIVVLAVCFRVITKPIESFLNEILGRPRMLSLIQMTCLVLSCVFVWLGSMLLGLTGVALGVLAASFCNFISLSILFRSTARSTNA